MAMNIGRKAQSLKVEFNGWEGGRQGKGHQRALVALGQRYGAAAVQAALVWYRWAVAHGVPQVPRIATPYDLERNWAALAGCRTAWEAGQLPEAVALAAKLADNGWPVCPQRLAMGCGLVLQRYRPWLAAWVVARDSVTWAPGYLGGFLQYSYERHLPAADWCSLWFWMVGGTRGRKAWDPVDLAWHHGHRAYGAWGTLQAVEYCGDGRLWAGAVAMVARHLPTG